MTQVSSSDKSATLRGEGLGHLISDLWQTYYILVAFVVMVFVSAIVSSNFFSWINLSNILRQSAVPGIVSLGMLVVILTAGIDLSVGSLVAVTGVLAVGLQRQLPLPGALLLAILAGLAAGAFNGVLVAKRNIPPFIATLGMMVIARGLTYVYTDGGPIQVTYRQAYSILGRSNVGPIPTIVITWVILAIITSIVLRRTTFGRTIISLGSNARAVYLSGINVDRHLIAVYTISGFMSAVGGILLTSRLTIGTPLMGQLMELDAIAAVVIGGASLAGGRGTVWGTIIGVLILGLISNMLNLMGVSAFYQDIIRGSIILLAVLFKAAQES
jgi:ribose transport system permease protein